MDFIKCPKCGTDLTHIFPAYDDGFTPITWICHKKDGGCGAIFLEYKVSRLFEVYTND